MHSYTREDFANYYGGSYFLHPKTGAVVSLAGPVQGEDVFLSDGTVVKLRDIDWEHVKTPRLGYRHVDDGEGVFFLSRRAGRRTEKGVCAVAVRIVPPIGVEEAARQLGCAETLHGLSVLSDKMAQSIFFPQFVTAAEATERLSRERNTLGFALDYQWALCLGTHRQSSFCLHYAGEIVATSENGARWKWANDVAKEEWAKL